MAGTSQCWNMFLSLAKRKTGKGNSEIFERMENS